MRKEKEMTARELGEILGVHEKYVFMLENGSRTPSLKLAFKIAEVFDEPIEKIWGG
ncbi:MAG TPA: helix-turn-helix transcriptional regulator [Thermoanaerobacterales bacterium]|nr:helix-turn-helix transcriptional regulator [Thermoanaerobacterales bacterium]